MFFWYLLNTFELITAFFFLYAAYTFTIKRKMKVLGFTYLAISVFSLGALYLCVQASGIMI